MGKQWLTGLILHVLHHEPAKSLSSVRTLTMDFDKTLERMAGSSKPEAVRVATSMKELDERTRSNVRATAESWLTLWADERVAHITSGHDLDPSDLMAHDQPVSLYLSGPLAELERLEVLTRIILRQVMAVLTSTLDHDPRGRKKRHELLLCLEEYPQLGQLPFMQKFLATGAGYGIRALLAAQSFSQLSDVYGRDSTLLANIHHLLAIPGNDPSENGQLAKMLGQTLEYRAGYSRKTGTFESSVS